MIVTNPGGGFAIGGGVPQTYTPTPIAGAAPQQSTGVGGFIKNLVGKIDWGSIFGQSDHEKEHIATIKALYERAAYQADAAAYLELHHRMTAKWVDVYGAGSADPAKWLRPQHERDLAAQALSNLATNTQFVAEVANNPLYAEIKKAAQDVRDALATAVGRIGAGAVQGAVDVVGGPNGKNTGGKTVPLSPDEILVITLVAGALVFMAFRKRGG